MNQKNEQAQGSRLSEPVGRALKRRIQVKIEIQRNESSLPIIYENPINAFTKGAMYCVLIEHAGKRVTHKFPLCSIFRVIEDYPDSKRA